MQFTLDTGCLLAIALAAFEVCRRLGRIEASFRAHEKATDKKLAEHGRHLRHHRLAIVQLGGTIPIDEDPA
jgi:hypothetical protein